MPEGLAALGDGVSRLCVFAQAIAGFAVRLSFLCLPDKQCLEITHALLLGKTGRLSRYPKSLKRFGGSEFSHLGQCCVLQQRGDFHSRSDRLAIVATKPPMVLRRGHIKSDAVTPM